MKSKVLLLIHFRCVHSILVSHQEGLIVDAGPKELRVSAAEAQDDAEEDPGHCTGYCPARRLVLS